MRVDPSEGPVELARSRPGPGGRRWRVPGVPGLLMLVALLPVAARPSPAQEVHFSGQVRPRLEFRDSLPAGDDSFTSMRVRAGIGAELDSLVRVFIQVQDVRIFGEETNTLSDFRADNFDLHQGYLEVRRRGSTTLSARVGRQELSFGRERLIGPVGWTQQGRSFDGVRLAADGPGFRVDLFATQTADATAPTRDRDAYFVGSYGTLEQVGPGALDLYLLFDHVNGPAATDQSTTGVRWFGERGRLRYRGELTLQWGDRAGADVTAFMFGGRIGSAFLDGAAEVTLWYDFLSGDDEPTTGTLRVFDTLFATNHPLYGFADFFTDIPRDTRGRGLQDLALKTVYRFRDDLSLAADLHSFHLSAADGLESGHLGEELDLTGAYRMTRHFDVVAGFSYLFAADGFAEIGRLTEDATWAYLMLDASF